MTNLTPKQQLLLAAQVAARAHLHQKRKDGTPYVAHPVRVALRIAADLATGDLELSPRDGLLVQVIALLHDVVEDTDITLDELRELGFEQVVVEGVDSVSKRPGETYANFILRAKQHPLGRVDKLYDIEDNTEDQSALDPDEATFLNSQYNKAKKELLDV